MTDRKARIGISSLSKVPEVNLPFWVIKILATTVGETAADLLNQQLGLGLPKTTVVMAALLAGSLAVQFRLPTYRPSAYWLVVVFISVVGTLITDNLTDGLGISLALSTVVFLVALLITFLLWFMFEGSISIHTITTPRREAWYWLAILFTFALGTAAGDLLAEKMELGYLLSAVLFFSLIGVVALGRFNLGLQPVLGFWLAYILTRPLGASIGDLICQPRINGGLGFGTVPVTIVFLVVIALMVGLTRADQIDQG